MWSKEKATFVVSNISVTEKLTIQDFVPFTLGLKEFLNHQIAYSSRELSVHKKHINSLECNLQIEPDVITASKNGIAFSCQNIINGFSHF